MNHTLCATIATLAILLLIAPNALAEEKEVRRNEQQVIDVNGGTAQTTWLVNFGPYTKEDEVINNTLSRTVFDFGAHVGLTPTGVSQSIIQLDLQIDGVDICRINAGRNIGQGQENFAHTRICVQQPMLFGEHNITFQIQSQVLASVQSWDIKTTQHVWIEGQQNLTLNISEVEIQTTAFMDFVWVLWAVFAAVVLRMQDPVMRAVAALVGFSVILLPLTGWQATIILAGQVALAILTGARFIEQKQPWGN